MAGVPLVVDIKRNALDDGPGIRSVVFFKGCPLRCVWCHNPEGIHPLAQVQRLPAACVGCRACVDACPRGAARPAAEPEPRTGCTTCGTCVDACPAAARRIAGTAHTVGELVESLARDAPFYRRSGGGVTLSGGEPTLFPEFAGAVAAGLKARGFHVLVETCGHFAWENVAEHLLPHVDTIYFDLKIADAQRHHQWTGRDNAVIHANLERLVARGFPDILPRIPLVPSLTDDDDNLRALAARVQQAGLRRIALLPYNPLWVSKRRALGGELPFACDSFMDPAHVARCRSVVADAGLCVVPGP